MSYRGLTAVSKPLAGELDPVVKPRGDTVKEKGLQLLATITPETNVASTAPVYKAQQVAFNDVPANGSMGAGLMPQFDGLLQDNAQFNAMMLAEKILVSTRHFDRKQV